MKAVRSRFGIIFAVALAPDGLSLVTGGGDGNPRVWDMATFRERHAFVGHEGAVHLEVETPVATATVRETEFNIEILEDGQTILTVIQGVVEFGTAFGTCPFRTSTVSYGVRGKRCTKPEATDIRPAVAWTEGITK